MISANVNGGTYNGLVTSLVSIPPLANVGVTETCIVNPLVTLVSVPPIAESGLEHLPSEPPPEALV